MENNSRNNHYSRTSEGARHDNYSGNFESNNYIGRLGDSRENNFRGYDENYMTGSKSKKISKQWGLSQKFSYNQSEK